MSSRRTVLAIALAAAFIIVGTTMTYASTLLPDFNGPIPRSAIVTVGSDSFDNRADIEWILTPSGQVTLYVGSDPANSGAVFVTLYCGARVEFGDADEAVGIEVGGDPADCVERGSAPVGMVADPAFQRISLLPDDADGFFSATGDPLIDWTVTAAGSRLARTPDIVAAPLFLAKTGEISPASGTLTAILQSNADEFRDNLSAPVGSSYESLQTAAARESAVTDVVDSVSWSTDVVNGTSELDPGVASWADASRRSAAQLELVLAGTFLGLGVGLTADVLLAAVQSDRPSRRRR